MSSVLRGSSRSRLALFRGKRCLYVTGQDGESGCYLSKSGGEWQHAVYRELAQAYLKYHTRDVVARLTSPELSFPDGEFDVVVIDRACEFVEDDGLLIAESHRVLAQDGRLIINAARAPRYSLLYLLRMLVGWSSWAQRYRRGYTESVLFRVLKDGFDVESVKKYSRLFVESIDLLTRAGARKMLLADQPASDDERGEDIYFKFERIERWYMLMSPLALLARLLDSLLLFSKGHCMVVRARPRLWRPRQTPQLSDGRSIADAALNTKIGTAAPF